MPIEPPPPTGAAYQTTAGSLGVLRPVLPTMDGQPVPQRLLAVRTDQGIASRVEWILRDEGGRPVKVSADGISSSLGNIGTVPTDIIAAAPYGILFPVDVPLCAEPVLAIAGTVKLGEAVSFANAIDATAVTVNGSDGLVQFDLPAATVVANGILQTEIRISVEGRAIFANKFYTIVERSLFADTPSRTGVPTIQDIRTAVRDAGTNDNYLLARLEWAIGDIAESLVQAVVRWNTLYPAVGSKYNTTNFYNPDALIGASLAYLYRQAGLNYERNNLGYSAAGVTVDDKNKSRMYLQLADQYSKAYDGWIADQKRLISRGNFSALIGSGYQRTAWWSRVGGARW